MSGKSVLLEDATEGLAANFDFNLLASVKPQAHALNRLSADFTSCNSPDEEHGASWMAEGDNLSLQK